VGTVTLLPSSPEIAVLRHGDPVVAQAIVALQRRAYRIEAELIGYPALPPLRESPADIMVSAEQFQGITSRGRLAAVISTDRAGETTTICRLCVAPECARRGYGTRLVGHVVRTARGPLLVSTARANTPAVGLYLKLGFETHREWTSPDGLALVTLRHSGVEGGSDK